MRWLFHVVASEIWEATGASYAPASLAREGFIHASYASAVRESARLHVPAPGAVVLHVDPRRLDVPVEVEETPRGPMPHIRGAIPRDAVRRAGPLADFAGEDEVRGTRFGFLAFPGMTLLDLVGVYDPLSRIASMGIDREASCTVVATGEPVVWAHGGASLRVDRVRGALDDFDVLIVPGGHATRDLRHDEGLIRWLAEFPVNRLVASVCSGALLLGAAGRLRGRRATSHASVLDLLPGYGAQVVLERVVDEGSVVTAGGVTSALDLGLHLIRRLHGDAAAARVAAQMEMR